MSAADDTFTSSSTSVTSDFVPYVETAWYHTDSDKRLQALQDCLVPLSPTSYKGSSGRVGVVGGSARYTGAPYYASMAALKVGADLAFCFCADEASLPIKSYSPELMVAPIYSARDFDAAVAEDNTCSSETCERLVQKMVDQVVDMMDKLHVLVVGPGLGRCPLVLKATAGILREAQQRGLPLVLDADALFLFTLDEYKGILQKDRRSLVILTPNAMERRRMQSLEIHWNTLPNVIVVEKGGVDRIVPVASGKAADKKLSTLECRESGGWKRSGGLGDILAGSLGTLVAWNTILKSRCEEKKPTLDETSLLLCWTACSFVKRATHVAFHKHHRAMTAPDVLEELGPTVHQMTTQS